MIRLTACLLLATFALGAVGCFSSGRYDDPWWNDDRRERNRDRDRDRDQERSERDPECQRNRGRVDEGKWRYAVEEFEARKFRTRKAFRQAKQTLLDDLNGVKNRACDWERPAVDRLLDRVRDLRFDVNDGSPE